MAGYGKAPYGATPYGFNGVVTDVEDTGNLFTPKAADIAGGFSVATIPSRAVSVAEPKAITFETSGGRGLG